MSEHIEVSVCAGCGILEMAKDSVTHKPACPICGSKIFKTATLPDKLRCNDCGVEKLTEKILKMYKAPPVYKHGRGTYYCGCYGWD